jgi:hypothetical protein
MSLELSAMTISRTLEPLRPWTLVIDENLKKTDGIITFMSRPLDGI